MIAVAMSGGVDSSAAAVVLRDGGEEIVGLSMQLWNQRRTLNGEDPADLQRSGRCCSLRHSGGSFTAAATRPNTRDNATDRSLERPGE